MLLKQAIDDPSGSVTPSEVTTTSSSPTRTICPVDACARSNAAVNGDTGPHRTVLDHRSGAGTLRGDRTHGRIDVDGVASVTSRSTIETSRFRRGHDAQRTDVDQRFSRGWGADGANDLVHGRVDERYPPGRAVHHDHAVVTFRDASVRIPIHHGRTGGDAAAGGIDPDDLTGRAAQEPTGRCRRCAPR